ncbi:MAG: ABC transporter ATP-binding protein [Lachnospiraceae bacterium]|nr:ABC transporter ATP-binding protein [Lachnospiraceae bacterium]
METILEIKDVRKQFGKKEILKGINLSVREGEIISVLGPSGCGKSTLLNLIAGILPLDGGSISIHGKEVSNVKGMTPAENRNINMVFQDFALWPHMKARDNILYGLKIKKTEKPEMEERLQEVVSLLHLDGLIDQYPSELSGGQQQRVAIARALITKPAIVLLDEPLCNLDIQLRIEMRTEMAQLFHSLNTTVFHVTHDPSEAFAMADRIVVMNQGVIDQNDIPSSCYMHPKTSMVAGLLGAGNCLKKVEIISKNNGFARLKVEESILEGQYSRQSVVDDCGLELRFRPEDCFWRDEEEENAIPVTVVMSTFEGGVYRVKVETDDREGFCVLHPKFLSAGRRGFIRISRERLYVYE